MITTRSVPALLPHHRRRAVQIPAPSEMTLPTPGVNLGCLRGVY
jgi:hypothetical protein